ncbi:mitochondrial 37S ribosomal protein rsm10 [Xylographa trunciseda]|nr:mitochondrial 37S ribosomal protein rsm10 [Xylographa trunciseda]
MSVPVYIRSAFSSSKRLRLDHVRSATPLVPVQAALPFSFRGIESFTTTAHYRLKDLSETAVSPPSFPSTVPITVLSSVAKGEYLHAQAENADNEVLSPDSGSTIPRLPRSVQAVYLRPLKRKAEYGIPSCDLQLRSYSVRNVEFFADFALRAAYYLNLAAAGPIPLPRITERWTVPRSNFVMKKSQENFERITLRRLIQIQDGHPDVVEIWLAFLRKHAYHGVGMKANVWNYEPLGVGKTMDVSLENLKQVLEPKWAHFGRKKNLDTSEKVMEMMNSDRLRKMDDGPFRTM